MTVAELINKLQKMQPQHTICIEVSSVTAEITNVHRDTIIDVVWLSNLK